jgi:RNA polymerase sigma-70 factor, ECF subfamily
MFDPINTLGGGATVDRCQMFEREALPHLEMLYAAALGITRNEHDARDLLQETMLRALRFFDLFQPGTDCRAWLMTILRNNFRTQWRRDGRELVAASASGFDHDVAMESVRAAGWNANPENILCARSVGGAIGTALDTLPRDFRIALILIDVRELSYGEAAAMLGVPAGTIKSRVARGRGMMRHALGSLARGEGLSAQRQRLRFRARPSAKARSRRA